MVDSRSEPPLAARSLLNLLHTKLVLGLLVWAVLGPVSSTSAQTSLPIAPSLGIPEARFATVNGQRMAFYDVGQGPVLVLVHGLGSSATLDWGQVIKPLSRNYRVIAVDNIGFGLSARPNIIYSAQTFADFLGELLKQLGIRHFNLAGESLGGYIAAAYTASAVTAGSSLPQVDRLVIVDGAIPTLTWPSSVGRVGSLGPVPPDWKMHQAQLQSFLFATPGYATDDYAKDSWKLMMSYDQSAVANGRAFLAENPEAIAADAAMRSRLKTIDCPTLIIWGKEDVLVPVANATYLASQIKGAHIEVVPGTGHAPAMERPARFLQLIGEFIPATEH